MLFGKPVLWFVIVVTVGGCVVGAFAWLRDILDENKRLRELADNRDDSDNDRAETSMDLRQSLAVAIKAVERMKIARTPEGIKAAADRVAQQIEDLYVHSFGDVDQRRRAISSVVSSYITIALNGGIDLV